MRVRDEEVWNGTEEQRRRWRAKPGAVGPGTTIGRLWGDGAVQIIQSGQRSQRLCVGDVVQHVEGGSKCWIRVKPKGGHDHEEEAPEAGATGAQ